MKLQAIVLTSISEPAAEHMKEHLESKVSIYSYEIMPLPAIVDLIYNEGPDRERIFSELDARFEQNPNARIILVSEASLSGIVNLANFDSTRGLDEQHELFLRHTVSILHARYRSKVVEVYTANANDPSRFKQVL